MNDRDFEALKDNLVDRIMNKQDKLIEHGESVIRHVEYSSLIRTELLKLFQQQSAMLDIEVLSRKDILGLREIEKQIIHLQSALTIFRARNKIPTYKPD